MMDDNQPRQGGKDCPKFVVTDWKEEVAIAERRQRTPEPAYEFGRGRVFYRKEQKK